VSKKKFSTGLDVLFEQSEESKPLDTRNEMGSKGSSAFTESGVSSAAMAVRKNASKNFTSDLDSLFNEAFTEAVEQKLEKMQRDSGISPNFEQKRGNLTQSLNGLDALIRSTIDTSLVGFEHAPMKRLSIMFENQKMEKLKSIARTERSFIKDLVSSVLSEFIQDYETKQKGLA
jgi:hypothetical protein